MVKCGKKAVKNVVNKCNIVGHMLTEIYQFVFVLSVFALFAFHVHVAGGTLSTSAGWSPTWMVWYSICGGICGIYCIVVVYIICPMAQAQIMGLGS